MEKRSSARADEGVPVGAPGVLDLVVPAVEVLDVRDESSSAADQQGHGAVAEVDLAGTGRVAQADVGGADEHVPALPAATASSAALRALVPQRNEPPKSAVTASGGRSSTRGDGRGGLLLLVRRRGGGEVQPPTLVRVHALETVARGGDGHGQAVLVVAGDGPLAGRRPAAPRPRDLGPAEPVQGMYAPYAVIPGIPALSPAGRSRPGRRPGASWPSGWRARSPAPRP